MDYLAVFVIELSRSLVSIPCFQVPQVVVNLAAGSTDKIVFVTYHPMPVWLLWLLTPCARNEVHPVTHPNNALGCIGQLSNRPRIVCRPHTSCVLILQIQFAIQIDLNLGVVTLH